MKNVDLRTIAFFTATAAAGWVVYKLLDKIAGAGAAAGNAIGDALAPLFVGGHAQVNASVMLPSGTTISFNQVVAEGGKLEYKGGDRYEFTYRNVAYRVAPPRRNDGVYVAVKA